MTTRTLRQVIESMPTSDGAGVKLRRSLGRSQGERLDPFLMLDEFFSDNPDDYLAGFPNHPHRGFETVTYMLDGHMLHQDHLGNRGDLKTGDVQWMTAGRGIIHSEMPQQERGRMRGFQLWINLPAKEKMKPAGYRDIPAAQIPAVDLPGGGRAKVIAGTLVMEGRSTPGPMQGLSTDPFYFDVELPAGARFSHPVKPDYSVFLYAYEGGVEVGPAGNARPLKTHSAGVLSAGDQIEVTATADSARFILLAGRPLREPIAQYGPFVMNTPAAMKRSSACPTPPPHRAPRPRSRSRSPWGGALTGLRASAIVSRIPIGLPTPIPAPHASRYPPLLLALPQPGAPRN